MTELSFHLWVIAAAVLCGVSCSLLGVFLVLRRLSLLGDAISHSVLPGLALGFLLSGSRSVVVMLIGAALSGLLTASLSFALSRWGRVDENASMGVVFTTLFAVGVLLIRQAADKVDLDPGCVLYGLLEFTPLDTIVVWGLELPRAVVILSGMLAVNLLFVAACFKELKSATFDPLFAHSQGISPNLMHYSLMCLVAATSVATFESVGSILAVAMFIIPAATARLLTDRLGMTLLLAVVVAALSAVFGYFVATGADTSVAGAMATVAGTLFLFAVILAPRYGIVSKVVRQLELKMQMMREDILALSYRCQEPNYRHAFPLSSKNITAALGGGMVPWLALFELRSASLVRRGVQGTFELTEAGIAKAAQLVRTHRLWEAYLVNHLKIRGDHVHNTASRLEHHTDAELAAELERGTTGITRDPHGMAIPGRENSSDQDPHD